MSKFERIVREPLVMGGQARIRDTGITVNEIVRLSLDGSSQAEILQKFPQLEAEDVYQALGYALGDTQTTIAICRSSAFEPLTLIVNYSQLVLGKLPLPKPKDKEAQEKADAAIEEFKQKYPELMLHAGNRAVAEIKVLSTWLRTNFRPLSEGFNAPLDYVLERGIKEANAFKSDLEIETFIEVDREFSVDDNAEFALTFILAGAYGVKPNGNLSIVQVNNLLMFTIKRELQTQIQVYQPTREYGLMEIARLVLYRLGSELKIHQEENTVIFEFALPIVEE